MIRDPLRVLATLFLWLLLSTAIEALAQPFDIPSPNVPSDVRGLNPSLTISFGSQKWADFNADGEMDFVMVGRLPATDLGIVPLFGDVFRSSPSRPEPTSPILYSYFSARTIQSMWLTDVDWGDYDNDGDLDLVVMGATSVDDDLAPETLLYQAIGDQVAAVGDATLPGVHSGGVAWGDFDRNGDLDLAISGVRADGSHLSTILRNDGGGAFVDVRPALPQLAYGDVDWIDYDLDGDPDLLLCGADEDGSMHLVVYRNDNNGTLVDSGQSLLGVQQASTSWGDYDADGDPDLVVSGFEHSPVLGNGRTRLYENVDGTFIMVPTTLPDVYFGDVQWVDYERDGDLDIIVTGRTEPFGSNTTVACLHSDGPFSCVPVQVAGLGGQPIPGVAYGTIGWADYDHDSDLDLFVTGDRGRDNVITLFYRNAGTRRNRSPGPPTALNATVFGSDVEMMWDAGTDDDAGASGLRYSVRVGTTPGGIDIVSPHSDPVTGRRYVHDGGNAGQSLRFSLVDLPAGTYFWSVQSVDISSAGSSFAGEQSFTIDG